MKPIYGSTTSSSVLAIAKMILDHPAKSPSLAPQLTSHFSQYGFFCFLYHNNSLAILFLSIRRQKCYRYIIATTSIFHFLKKFWENKKHCVCLQQFFTYSYHEKAEGYGPAMP